MSEENKPSAEVVDLEKPKSKGSDFQTTPGAMAGPVNAERDLSVLPVMRKPSPEVFVRVSTDPNHIATAVIYESQNDMDRQVYLVHPRIAHIIPKPVVVTLRLAVTGTGAAFIWAVRQPTDGREDTWGDSMRRAVDKAAERWVRVAPDMAMRSYAIWNGPVDPDPVFPPVRDIDHLFDLGFSTRVVDDENHELIQMLQGLKL